MIRLMISGFIIGVVSSPTCPSNGEEIKHGTKYGLTSSVTVGLGAVFGDAVVLVAILLWLMPFIDDNSLWIMGLWLLGGFVLFYVAWGIFKEMKTVQSVGEKQIKKIHDSVSHYLKAFWTGTAITTFNPFTVLWWMGLLTPIIDSGNRILVIYPVAVLFGALLWFMLLALLLHLGEKWLNRKRRQGMLLISGLAVLCYSFYFLFQFFKQVIQ